MSLASRTLASSLVAGLLAAIASCGDDGAAPPALARAEPPATEAAVAVEGPLQPAAVRSGGAIQRLPDGRFVYVADEDHRCLRRIPLPLDANDTGEEIMLPGSPAQVLPLSDSVLVTVRDPGLLLVMGRVEGGSLVERARIALPPDAWGIGVTADERTAVVTSAWSAKVSVVDLTAREVTSTLEVAREPRGVAITREGIAYVSHLTSSALTRIDLGAGALSGKSVALPASPMRAPVGRTLDATLGWSIVLSPDERRLYAPRHAIGALGIRAWYGAPSVDVLLTRNDEPLAPTRRPGGYTARLKESDIKMFEDSHGVIPFVSTSAMTQPRAAVYRATTDTMLVVGEGTDSLVEVDPTMMEPALATIRVYPLGQHVEWTTGLGSFCSAPRGVALSADESTAYVYCAGSFDLATVALSRNRPGDPPRGEVAGLRLAEETLEPEVARGRRIFYSARESMISGGLACAGCHPEGRDDAQTWHEVAEGPMTGRPIFIGSPENMARPVKGAAGTPRQTPMLAGRVSADGPYGWHAESKSLEARMRGGFGIHRWDGFFAEDAQMAKEEKAVARFLREGLVPPPRETHAMTPEERRGQELFNREDVGCAGCHDPRTEYTDRVAYPFDDLPQRPGYEEDPNPAFKTPSLEFIAGTAPYFHDGSAHTLEELIDRNGTRMGKTGHLSRADRKALVSFLKTL